VLFAAAVMGSAIIRRQRSISAALGTGAILVMLAISSAVFLRTTAAGIAHALDVSVTYVDPGLPGYLGPPLFGSFVFAVGQWTLNGAWTSRRALRFYLWLLVFTAANIVNTCSPGWCETVGFPFAWRSWSDAMITTGNDYLMNAITAVAKTVGALLNLFTFAAAAAVFAGIRTPQVGPSGSS
jgi:hypothetical protein